MGKPGEVAPWKPRDRRGVATRSPTSEESQEVEINSEVTGDLGEDICRQVCVSGRDREGIEWKQ